MKLTVGAYEVDIKVKTVYEDRASTKSTCDFLNAISCALYAEAELGEMRGMKGMPPICKEEAEEIYQFLEKRGYYDRFK